MLSTWLFDHVMFESHVLCCALLSFVVTKCESSENGSSLAAEELLLPVARIPFVAALAASAFAAFGSFSFDDSLPCSDSLYASSSRLFFYFIFS